MVATGTCLLVQLTHPERFVYVYLGVNNTYKMLDVIAVLWYNVKVYLIETVTEAKRKCRY